MDNRTIECVILAGGKGKRLEPYTTEIPKPLVQVGDTPIIEFLIKLLKKNGIRKITIAVNHLAEKIMSLLGDGSQCGVSIKYSHEEKELSTVAPLKLIKDLPENFLVVNGDILTDLNFSKLFESHLKSKALLTVAVCQREHPVDYGVLEIDENNMVTGFFEKPKLKYTVSMGVYIFSKNVLKFIPDNEKFGFDDMMLFLLKNNNEINTFPYDGYWLDIGRPDDLKKANDEIQTIKKMLD